MNPEITSKILAHMLEAIESPPPTIEESIKHAEEEGWYSHEEAELYMKAYERCFNKGKELYPDGE